MGLDVYVGSLTRYYAGDWETIVQKHGREQGYQVMVVRPNMPADADKETGRIRSAVLLWRHHLSQGLGADIRRPLDWDESDTAPYFTDKPAWDCYASLLLWAAYAEHPDLVRPLECIEDYSTDPAYQRCANPDYASTYSQLLRNVEVWLPCDFPFTFIAGDPAGNQMTFGSSIALLSQLEELNRKTWNASNATVSEWRRHCAKHLSPMEEGAKFAFAIMSGLARDSVEHRLVMKLDY